MTDYTKFETGVLKDGIEAQKYLIQRYKHNITTSVLERSLEDVDAKIAKLAKQRQSILHEMQNSPQLLEQAQATLAQMQNAMVHVNHQSKIEQLLKLAEGARELEDDINSKGKTFEEIRQAEREHAEATALAERGVSPADIAADKAARSAEGGEA